ncbi:hypothetical protein F4680DRAFT_421436 [Xylaria scruposa]|nr:hypothetical protein F4680DRAFT_421436 [Xylaria scruposa]
MTSRNAIPSAHQYSQGSFDVVATQGAYLLPHPRTPVFQKGYDEQFAARLEINLRMVIVVQEIRRHKYGEVADEFRRGYTPPEAREKREAELKAMAELWERSDSSDNDSDGCEIDKYKGGSDSNAQVGPGKPVATPDQPPRPHQTHCLPSPPSSAESSLATTHKRKRRISSDDEEEKEHPAKKQIGFAQKPNTTQ